MADAKPTPFFIGDDLALDFLNSVATPWGKEIEWLATGEDLLAWLGNARVVPPEVLTRFRARGGPRALDAAASEARALREWFRVFVRDHAGKPIEPGALGELAAVNRLLQHDETYRLLEARNDNDAVAHDGDSDHALRWQVKRRWHNPKALLLPLAEAIGELVCRKDFTLVRHCEGPACTLWFLDVSKAHARRWCSMAVCGNRAKAAAHRARSKRGRNADTR